MVKTGMGMEQFYLEVITRSCIDCGLRSLNGSHALRILGASR